MQRSGADGASLLKNRLDSIKEQIETLLKRESRLVDAYSEGIMSE